MRKAAMALGTTELSARSTLWPPTSTPLTSSTSSNSEGSSTSTSRKRIGTSSGMWLSSRCLLSLALYSSGSSVARRRWATMWISPPLAASSMSLWAASSISIRSWRSSVERCTRETSETTNAHRDFLYAIFERAPDARAITVLALYEGLTDFEATHQRAGRLNVGSFFEPVRFEDCCDCLKKYPLIEAMVPEPSLGEYALGPGKIYSGLERRRE